LVILFSSKLLRQASVLIALGHFAQRQHLLDLARLTSRVELGKALAAQLGHGFHRGLQIFAWIEF
jgi:hypothetical protein